MLFVSLFVCCMLFSIPFTIFSLKSISVEKEYNYYVLNGVSENLKIQGFVKKKLGYNYWARTKLVVDQSENTSVKSLQRLAIFVRENVKI